LGARSEGKLKTVAERIASQLSLTSKRQPVYYPVDVADEKQVEQIVRYVEKNFVE
jgi:NADP-dependent 3-hydroxy acid dehydrogenase YdfG